MRQFILVTIVAASLFRAAAADINPVQDIRRAVDRARVQLAELTAPRQATAADSLSSSKPPAARDLEILRSDLECLCDRVEALARTLDSMQSAQTNLADLLADIELLKSVNELLIGKLNQNSPQLASLDDDLMPMPALTNPEVSSQDGQTLPPVAVSGFVAATGSGNDGPSRSDFGLDQIEIDLASTADNPASVTAEVECNSNDDGGFDFDLEQAYLSIALNQNKSLVLSLGKFNSPVGWEGMDAPQMYQCSYANISNCLPGNLTGLLFDAQLNQNVSLSAFVSNGWDVNRDNNSDKTIGGRFGYARSEFFDIGFSAIHGPEQDDNVASQRTVYDIDFTLTPSSSWLVGGEIHSGRESNMLDNNGTARWHGGLITNRIRLSESVEFALRYDYLNDVHGWQTGVEQQLHGFTVAPAYYPVEGVRLLLEGKYLISNRQGLIDSLGNPDDDQLSFAIGCSYSL